MSTSHVIFTCSSAPVVANGPICTSGSTSIVQPSNTSAESGIQIISPTVLVPSDLQVPGAVVAIKRDIGCHRSPGKPNFPLENKSIAYQKFDNLALLC